jgi:hypothetical protein
MRIDGRESLLPAAGGLRPCDRNAREEVHLQIQGRPAMRRGAGIFSPWMRAAAFAITRSKRDDRRASYFTRN